MKVTCYPMGFPVKLETNSGDVLDAANELWARFSALSEGPAIRFRVTVEDRDARVPPQPLVPRTEGRTVYIVHGPDNFAVCDVASSVGFACLTRDIARNRAYVQYHFLEAAIYTMLDAGRLAPVHAACVDLRGRATLLCGESGAGKTSLAYECAKRGWTFVSGDATHIVRARSDRRVVGRPFGMRLRETAAELFPELRMQRPACRPNGKVDYEIDTSAFRIKTAVESNAACIVFLNRQSDSVHPRVEPFPREEALQQFAKVLFRGDPKIFGEQKTALTRLLELPVVRLTYRNPGDAEVALRGLVQ